MSQQKTILVVEDEEAIGLLVAQSLKDWGYRVLLASNGNEGLEWLKKEKPDLVLMDLNMPKMSGVSLYSCLRSLGYGKDTPVLLMTGHIELVGLLTDFRYDGILTKPFSLEDLQKEVSRILPENKGLTLQNDQSAA